MLARNLWCWTYIEPSLECHIHDQVWYSTHDQWKKIQSIHSLCQRHNVKHQLYADDIQINLSLSLKNPDITLKILTKCLQDVSSWMSSRKLRLNPDQTECLLIGYKVQREQISKCFPIRLLAQEVTPFPSARNLGIAFDSAINISYIWYISRLLLSYTRHA